MRARAYAKVNLGLRVGKKRSDGYHDIDTYMALIDLYDDITMEVYPACGFSCRIEKEIGYNAEGRDLMEIAAEAFSLVTGLTFHADITIYKRIPSGAGLGGGSSDAAAVLRMLAGYFGVPDDSVMKAAAMTGSDVMFFASGFCAAHVMGRGDIISPISIPQGLSVCVCVPGKRISTANAYKNLDSIERTVTSLPPLAFNPVPDENAFCNDFETVFPGKRPFPHPKSPCYVSLTGSGSGWIAIFPESSAFEIEKTEDCDIFMASFIISG